MIINVWRLATFCRSSLALRITAISLAVDRLWCTFGCNDLLSRNRDESYSRKVQRHALRQKCIVCRHLLLTAWFFTAFRITFFQQPKAKPWDEKSLNSGKSKSCIKDQDKRSHISVYQAGCLSVPRLCQIYWSVLAQGHKTISYIVCTRPKKPKKPENPKN